MQPEIVKLNERTYEERNPDILISAEEQIRFVEVCETILLKDDALLKRLLLQNSDIWFKYVTLRASDCTCGSTLLEHVGFSTVNDLHDLLTAGSCEHVEALGFAFKEDAGIQIIHWLAARGTSSMMELALTFYPDLIDSPTLLHQLSPLVIAIVAENMDIVRYLVEKGANLHLVLKSRSHDLVGKLLSLKEEEDNFGLDLGTIADNNLYIRERPLLLYLISADVIQPHMLETLLQITTWNLNASDNAQETALMYAVRNKNIQLVHVLLTAGADPNYFKYERGLVFPVLFSALSLRFGFEEVDIAIITALLEAGAEPNLMFFDSPINSIDYAVQAGNHVWWSNDTDTRPEPNMNCRDAEEPIVENCYEFKLNILRLLLRFGADVNNSRGLHYAAEVGSLEIAEILLSAGYSKLEHTGRSRATAKHPATPLNLAAIYNNWNVLQRLVQHGCDVNTANRFGNTPLHHAAMNGCAKSVELLLASGARANARNMEGATPLWDAVQSEQLEACAILMCHDANLNARSRGLRQNLGPFRTIVGYPGNERVCLKVRSLLWMAVESQNRKLVDLLLSCGLNVRTEEWILTDFEDTENSDSFLRERLTERISSPTPLESLCRRCVLLTYGHTISKLPSEYKCYLPYWVS